MTAEQPLLLVTELEPMETGFLAVGSSFRLHLSIVSAETKAPADPDALTLTVTPPYQAPTVYTYGVGVVIVKVSTGLYYADISLTVPSKWRAQYQATLNSIACGSNTSSVIAVAA